MVNQFEYGQLVIQECDINYSKKQKLDKDLANLFENTNNKEEEDEEEMYIDQQQQEYYYNEFDFVSNDHTHYYYETVYQLELKFHMEVAEPAIED